MPHKSGNIYVYNEDVHEFVDYAVPTTRYASLQTGDASATAPAADPSSAQDYDIPSGVSPSSAAPCRYDDDYDVDFGVGDYDLLSPPQQRPASDVSSNRSSVTSVVSGGSSLSSSGCASIRSAQSPSIGVSRSAAAAVGAGGTVNGFGSQLHGDPVALPRRYVTEATSDSSADSGIALPAPRNTPVTNHTSKLNGVSSCRQNVTPDDVDCADYDVPMADVVGAEERSLYVRTAATLQCQPVRNVSPVVISDELHRRNDDRCAEDIRRRRRVEELHDCVMRNVQRFLAWTGRATGDAFPDDAAVARHSYGQAKLAGLAVRTSLKELLAAVDGNPPELLRRHVEPLSGSLLEVDRRLDCLISSGGEGRPPRAAGGRRAARESPTVCHDHLHSVAEVVADLPELVKRFTDFVAANSAIVVRPRDDVDVIQPSVSFVVSKAPAAPTPPQRRESRQRDGPSQSPPAVAGGSPRDRRPPLGKPPPPPVKPKPPKSVTWKRPPETHVEPRRAGSPPETLSVGGGTASKANERRVAELNEKNGPSTTDGWNEADSDYVSIVREVEREMQSPRGKMTTTTAQNSSPRTAHPPPRASAPISDDDRELLEFYALQIGSHAADVDIAAADFRRCCPSASGSPPPPVDAFVRRSRFVVLAAHRLVYVGDVIARHVTDQQVRDRVAAAANALCDQLKAVVMATRDAAIANGDNENPAAAVVVRQTMIDSVRRATEDCRRLSNVINAISCQ